MTLLETASQKGSIAIVASTLPAGFIVAQVESMGIFKIVVMSSNLELSYRVIREKYPGVQVKLVPRGPLSQIIFFAFMLLRARLSGTRISIFHECCLPHLDLLLMLIRPHGFYFPLSTMSEWEEVSISQFKKAKFTSLLQTLNLDHRFRYFRSPGVGDNKIEYAISAKNYPASIVAKDLSYARGVTTLTARKHEKSSQHILFITSKSFVPDSVQVKMYITLIDISLAMGCLCSIKDHPNPIYRLNISHNSAFVCDPFVPAELLEDDFDLIVGVSSTALLAYGNRSVSLVYMFPEMRKVDLDACINAYDELTAPDCKMRYVSTIDDFKELILV
jgi:hypothetical protein